MAKPGGSTCERGARKTSLIAALLLAALGCQRAEAIEFGCRIGRPAYCLKYGQMFCLKENSLAEGRDKACELWTAACFVCHARIPECLGGTRPSHKSALCRSCETEWRDCMHSIDAAYWPNRLRRNTDSEPADVPAGDDPGAAGGAAEKRE